MTIFILIFIFIDTPSIIPFFDSVIHIYFFLFLYFCNICNFISIGPELLPLGCGLHENKEAKDGVKMAVNALYASKPRDRNEVNIMLSE